MCQCQPPSIENILNLFDLWPLFINFYLSALQPPCAIVAVACIVRTCYLIVLFFSGFVVDKVNCVSVFYVFSRTWILVSDRNFCQNTLKMFTRTAGLTLLFNWLCFAENNTLENQTPCNSSMLEIVIRGLYISIWCCETLYTWSLSETNFIEWHLLLAYYRHSV